MSKELRLEIARRKQEQLSLQHKQETLAADIRSLTETPEGQRIFHWLLEQGNIFRMDYEPGIRGAYAAGKKAAALALWHKLKSCLSHANFVALAFPVVCESQDYPSPIPAHDNGIPES